MLLLPSLSFEALDVDHSSIRFSAQSAPVRTIKVNLAFRKGAAYLKVLRIRIDTVENANHLRRPRQEKSLTISRQVYVVI